MSMLLKIGKWYWMAVFIVVAVLETIHAFQHESLLKWTLYYSHIPLMLFITLLIFHRNWLSWLFMITLCAFGLYNLFTWGLIASGPTSMDFGFWPSYLSNIYPYRRIIKISTSPEFFYFFTLILYLTKPVRKKYFNPEKLASEESILPQSS
ncbi:hypothetical protein SRABI27_01903 [Pedobacter sp. Bi27]|uniref:hypothetical protein n=1 Tax=Pedobacter sp. Bi27 TaxID=2822351 RepID=UPI001DE59F05|nr:hypothetical protein [Pedobacter sp. Bi27]CAH0207589.1 hypothetical protein SRABI27_01903 [Pedobacter sp. Bi27]